MSSLVPAWLNAGRDPAELWAEVIEALPKVQAHRRLGLLSPLMAAMPSVSPKWKHALGVNSARMGSSASLPHPPPSLTNHPSAISTLSEPCLRLLCQVMTKSVR